MKAAARLADNDREDIRSLVSEGLTSAAEIEARATEALVGYVGGIEMLRANLRDAVAIARDEEQAVDATQSIDRPKG